MFKLYTCVDAGRLNADANYYSMSINSEQCKELYHGRSVKFRTCFLHEKYPNNSVRQ